MIRNTEIKGKQSYRRVKAAVWQKKTKKIPRKHVAKRQKSLCSSDL